MAKKSDYNNTFDGSRICAGGVVGATNTVVHGVAILASRVHSVANGFTWSIKSLNDDYGFETQYANGYKSLKFDRCERTE